MAWKFFTSEGRLLTSGQPGPAGPDGTDGIDGTNGTDGDNVISVEEGNVLLTATAATLDFGAGFDLTEAGGEVEVGLDASEVSGAPVTQALGDTVVTGAASTFANSAHKHALTRPVIDAISDVDTTSTPPATGDTLIYDGANWVPDSAGVTSGGGTLHPPASPFYGDGSDGAVDLDGTNTYSFMTKTTTSWYQPGYYLLRDVYVTTLRIRAGQVLQVDGFRIFAQSITVDSGASLIARGGHGVTSVDASGISAGSTSNAGSLPASQAGIAGRSTSGVGASGTNQTANTTPGTGASGAGSGKGGTGGTSTSAGGTVGTVGALIDSQGGIGVLRQPIPAINWRGINIALTGGTAGTAGGCNVGTGTASSGAGGVPGAEMVLVVREITNSGTISAVGGAGGNASGTGNGAAGGGGGGGGGFILIVTRSYTGTAPTVAGGALGTGWSAGAIDHTRDGAAGSDGLAVVNDGPY